MAIEVLGFDHVDLTVNDLGRSEAFYRKVLGELGFRFAKEGATGDPIYANATTSIALHGPSEARRGATFDRYRVGLHHLAFRAARREDVDAFHAFLVREGLPVLDAPSAYPEYGVGYYAVFWPDPDGIKLELVHYPWGYWKRTMTVGDDARPRFPHGRPRDADPEG